MLAAALVDPQHDGAHHPRLPNCHLLLFAWHLPLSSGWSLIQFPWSVNVNVQEVYSTVISINQIP